MRTCGECTLCCKLERITELNKPRDRYCDFCLVGVGCNVYQKRPNSCRTFKCWWLSDPEVPDSLRPDKVGAYAAGDPAGGYLRVMVDGDARDGWTFLLLKAIRAAGLHAIVVEGDRVRFVQGPANRPQRILLDWTL